MAPADRLTVAAVAGGLRQRAWSLLTVSAFLVLAAAGAASPMFAEASGNAAFQARRDQVPVTARQNDAPVVRLSANAGPTSLEQESVLEDLRAVPGLTEPDLTGGSFGAETAGPLFWGSTVSLGAERERARLFAVGSPESDLVAVGKPAGRDGVWLPEPVATALGASAGDRIVLAVVVGKDGEPRQTTVAVDGVYAVDAAGRLPADPPGSRKWALRQGDTPGDTEYRTLPAYLLIGATATVERLAQAVGDEIFWSAEAELVPGSSLAEARQTAEGVEDLRRSYATSVAVEDDVRALRFASGIGRIVDASQATTDQVRQRTRPVEWAAIIVGLASVLAVALLSARRRERELRHVVAVGLSPVRVGGLWGLENLLPALLGAGLGWLVAWQLVTRLGPPGAVTESLRPAALLAGAAALAGLVTVAGVGAAAAARRVRPAPPATVRRALPWAAMVVVIALVAAGGLVSAGGAADGARGVDLLVPLLVLAAVGVVAGRLPGLLAGRRRRTARLPGSPGRAVLWLARRRLGSGGTERRLAVVVVTTGLGMLLFALSAVQSTAVSADDRVAVASGAEAVATLQGSWEVDKGAAQAPPEDPLGAEPPDKPVPGVRNPPMPAGDTVVWRTDTTSPLDDDQRDLLLIDPAQFRDAALWGRGADLAEARAAVADLVATPVDAEGTPRVITVADPASDRLDAIQVEIGFSRANLAVASRVAAFPGLQSRPMYVAAADPTLKKLGRDDPRLRPLRQQSVNAVLVQAQLWSSAGAAGIQAVTGANGVVPERVSTADQLRQDAAYVATGRARGYQLAIAGYLALLAVLTLCIYAQRTAALRGPTDLMLARVGLGRARIRRAQTLEFVLLAAVAFAAAVGGVAALAPLGTRLLDDQPRLLPAFDLQLSGAGVAVTAGVAVLATVLAVALTAVRSATAEEDAYRDD
ncbi:hypothetical protein [Actinoplanes friuliensis]|uniref:ABC3 transporter permease protein domain-containing protein n=1 Tax=Actinoplanes friuliensis DSM 7358 TaxID=1246995 RepID=U5VVI5_9ACTN|nr:hypothetical protein [Actinoplanes friuliensis]AGZ39636.1 hypothetical protein AFR_06735 [Actinoplanes friuliensis DSM 7358]